MRLRFAAFILLCLTITSFSLTGCNQQAPTYKRQILSFGTQIDVTLYGVDKAQADAAIKQIEAQLDVMHVQWHAWRKGSLTEINKKLVSGIPFTADSKVLPLIKDSQQLYLKTKGRFNPAIGKLIELWGFYKDDPENNTKIPSADAIEKLVKSNPNMSDIIINGNTITGTNPDLQLDLGGYAKGYGVDRLVEQLQKQGINNALINAGGDLHAIGSPGIRPWKIAIQDPDSQQALGWLELTSNESVFSSGDYRRHFSNNGKNYHHIIDPRTGYPSENAKAVTVVHSNGAVADAAATALMVAAPEEWLSLAKYIGLQHLLVVNRKTFAFARQKSHHSHIGYLIN